MAVATTNGYERRHLYVKTTFLDGELKNIAYVTQPEGNIKKGSRRNYMI